MAHSWVKKEKARKAGHKKRARTNKAWRKCLGYERERQGEADRLADLREEDKVKRTIDLERLEEAQRRDSDLQLAEASRNLCHHLRGMFRKVRREIQEATTQIDEVRERLETLSATLDEEEAVFEEAIRPIRR